MGLSDERRSLQVCQLQSEGQAGGRGLKGSRVLVARGPAAAEELGSSREGQRGARLVGPQPRAAETQEASGAHC